MARPAATGGSWSGWASARSSWRRRKTTTRTSCRGRTSERLPSPSESPPRDFRATPETRLFPRTLHTYTCEQVIAVLDRDILAQLVGGYRYHQERCAEAVAGRGVVAPPALTSLECCYAEGAWVYRVTAAAGATVFEGPSRAHPTCGHYAQGEHVRVLQVISPHISPYLPTSPHTSPYLPHPGCQWMVAARAGGPPLALLLGLPARRGVGGARGR